MNFKRREMMALLFSAVFLTASANHPRLRNQRALWDTKNFQKEKLSRGLFQEGLADSPAFAGPEKDSKITVRSSLRGESSRKKNERAVPERCLAGQFFCARRKGGRRRNFVQY